MEYIDLKDIYTNSKNFYPQTDIENKKKQIVSAGLLENLVVIREENDHGQHYKLLSGERRYRAMLELLGEGFSEFETVPCTVREPMADDEEILQLVISNTSRTKDLLTVLTEEKTVLTSLKRIKAGGKTIKGYDLSSGRLRDIAASMIGISSSKAAQIEAINNNIDPDILEVLREEDNGLTFTYLYTLSSLDKEKQRAALAKWRSTGTWEKVEKKVRKPAANSAGSSGCGSDIDPDMESENGSDDQDSGMDENPAGIDYTEASLPSKLSICYRCRHYETCADKGASVDSCDRYEKRLSMQKTTDQLYSEEQSRIDKETQSRLNAIGFRDDGSGKSGNTNEEVLETPNDELIRITSDAFKSLSTGRKPYIILKGNKYRSGDEIHIAEFKNGELLQGRITARIICTDTSATSAAITDGYVLAGIEILEIA